RRRAQNRASQRAFRERKEKHVQHLERELELLETKHQDLEKSYVEAEGARAKLQREVEELRDELGRVRTRGGGEEEGNSSSSREGSAGVEGVKREEGEEEREAEEEEASAEATKKAHLLFDPFACDGYFGSGGGGTGSDVVW
ncbi:MAG: hypothetical protein Q9163_004013, partial [Psora crenata]